MPLQPDGEGTWSGDLELPPHSRDGAYLVVSSEPKEVALGTTAVELLPEGELGPMTLLRPLELLLDGLPQVEAEERARVRRARRRGAWVVGSLGLGQVLGLAIQGKRRGYRALPEGLREGRARWLLGLILLAYAAVLLLLVLGGSPS